jgi:hypothetical protein
MPEPPSPGSQLAAKRRTASSTRGSSSPVPGVRTPPGEEHWHGALPDHFMTHLAMWEDDDATWGDHVTDEEYAAATASAGSSAATEGE